MLLSIRGYLITLLVAWTPLVLAADFSYQTGDIILGAKGSGDDITSKTKSPFIHSGIINVSETGKVTVIHASPRGVEEVDIQTFTNNFQGVRVKRYPNNNVAIEAIKIAKEQIIEP